MKKKSAGKAGLYLRGCRTERGMIKRKDVKKEEAKGRGQILTIPLPRSLKRKNSMERDFFEGRRVVK